MAYRLLARNQPVPQQVVVAAQGEFLNIKLCILGDYSIFCIAFCHMSLFCLENLFLVDIFLVSLFYICLLLFFYILYAFKIIKVCVNINMSCALCIFCIVCIILDIRVRCSYINILFQALLNAYCIIEDTCRIITSVLLYLLYVRMCNYGKITLTDRLMLMAFVDYVMKEK